MEDEATPRPRVQIQIQIVHPHDMLSENDYGDDEGSFSDSSSVLTSSQASYGSDNGFLTQTPLLSSSLPYDPDQDHPHHEHLPHRQASFSTLGEPPAILGSSILGDSDRDVVRADDSNADDDYDDDRADIVTVHEDDDDRAEEAVNSEPITNNDWHQELSSSIRSPRRRIYPTWPPYSSSYHQNHFPHAFPTAPEPSISGSTIRHHHSRRRVYGIPVDRLPVYLPFMWRAAAALKHVGHALLFAWAPALVFDGRFQWWCFLVLLVLALRKGWNTVEWFGGTASR